MNVPSRSISSVRRSLSIWEPSHQTILDGLARRADSSTQLSSGVDKLALLGLPAGNACGRMDPAGRKRRDGVHQKNFRSRVVEKQDWDFTVRAECA